MITHLLYRSFTQGDLNASQIERILDVSKRNNERDGLSGVLLYRSRIFLQLLEGDARDVQKCMTRIRADSRHYSPGVILTLESDRRLLPHWSMAHIAESKVRKPFDTVELLVQENLKNGAPTRQTILNILREFASGLSTETP